MSSDDDGLAGAAERLSLSDEDGEKVIKRNLAIMDGCMRAMHDSGFVENISADEYAQTEYSEIIKTVVECRRLLRNARSESQKVFLENSLRKLEGLRVIATQTLQRMRRAEGPNPSFRDLQYVATDPNSSPTMCVNASVRFKDVIPEINTGHRPALVYKIGEKLRACGHCNKMHTKMSKCGKCKLVHYCSVECQARMWKDHEHECEMFLDVDKNRARELRERIRVLSNTLRINANPTTVMFDDALCAQLDHGGLLWSVCEGHEFFTFTHATPLQFFKFCNEHGCGVLALAERQAGARIFFSDLFGVMHVHDGRVVMIGII